MNNNDLRATIIIRADEMRAGLGGIGHDTAVEWVKRAAWLCLKLGWWAEYVYLKDSWAI